MLYEGEFFINDRPNQNYEIFLRKVNLKNMTNNFDADLTLLFKEYLEADALSYTYEVYEKKTTVLVAERAMFFTEATAAAVGNVLGLYFYMITFKIFCQFSTEQFQSSSASKEGPFLKNCLKMIVRDY